MFGYSTTDVKEESEISLTLKSNMHCIKHFVSGRFLPQYLNNTDEQDCAGSIFRETSVVFSNSFLKWLFVGEQPVTICRTKCAENIINFSILETQTSTQRKFLSKFNENFK